MAAVVGQAPMRDLFTLVGHLWLVQDAEHILGRAYATACGDTFNPTLTTAPTMATWPPRDR